MAAYTCLAREKFHLPTYPVLVVMLRPGRGKRMLEKFEALFLGKRTLVEYTVLRMWQMDPEPVFSMPIPTLLPFVPLMRGGAGAKMVQRAAVALRNHEGLEDLEPLLAMLASYVLKPEVVQEIVRLDMATILKNPFEEEIKQIGRQEGIQEGEQRSVLALLTERFGQVNPAASEAVRRVRDDDVLRHLLVQAATCKSLNEFLSALNAG
jgi:predicted transposase YdaD